MLILDTIVFTNSSKDKYTVILRDNFLSLLSKVKFYLAD